MPKKVVNPKIACLDFSLQKSKMKLGVQVLVEDPENLEAIRQRWEYVYTKKKALWSGAYRSLSIGPCTLYLYGVM